MKSEKPNTNLSNIEGMKFNSDGDVFDYLSKITNKAKLVHNDPLRMIIVASSGKKKYNLHVSKDSVNGTREVLSSKEYGIMGKTFLKLGIYWIGIKDADLYAYC
jgi:hypothetical protein